MDIWEMVADNDFCGIKPRGFGYQSCKPNHHFGPGVRLQWIIHYVISGCGIFKIGDKEYKIGAGEMFVIPPFTEIYYGADSENPWIYTWIEFTADRELPVELTPVIVCGGAAKVFADMRQCSGMKAGKNAFLTARIWDLLSVIINENKSDIGYIEKAIGCMKSEYAAGITVEEIAERLNLDRTYFSVMFKKKVGLSPKQYLFEFKMETAATLMVKYGKSPSVAAASVGYNDIYSFSKMFKKHFGLSPREYVRQNKKV